MEKNLEILQRYKLRNTEIRREILSLFLDTDYALSHQYIEKKLEAKFVKKATGVIIFTCEDGQAIQDTVNEALNNPAGSKLAVTSIGRNQAGEVVAEFYLTWTFKAKSL